MQEIVPKTQKRNLTHYLTIRIFSALLDHSFSFIKQFLEKNKTQFKPLMFTNTV